MKAIKSIRREESCVSPETAVAKAILDLGIDQRPEGMRVVVIVASGDGTGRIGCSFDGYDCDELLARDLQLLSQAVDLGGDQ